MKPAVAHCSSVLFSMTLSCAACRSEMYVRQGLLEHGELCTLALILASSSQEESMDSTE